jgi:hypothetical protein
MEGASVADLLGIQTVDLAEWDQLAILFCKRGFLLSSRTTSLMRRHDFASRIIDDCYQLARRERRTTMVAYSSKSKSDRSRQLRRVRLGNDSLQLRDDNCASCCVSNRLTEFYKPPKPISDTSTVIHGSSVSPLSQCHGRSIIEDDDGVPCTIDILVNLIVDSHARSRLLSPQHWVQLDKDHD